VTVQKKDEKKCIKCCGNNHKMDDCNSEQRCNNCAEKKKNKKNVDEKHTIFDKKCSCYQNALKSLCHQIDMDEPRF